MKRFLPILLVAILAACTGGQSGSKTETYEGLEISGPISKYQTAAIQQRQIDAINALRTQNGLNALTVSTPLVAAGVTHSHDIAAQQRAWNYGSDKSTPQTRADRAGFAGLVTGELVAETYLGENDVVNAWSSNGMSRAIILDPAATNIGVAYYMEKSQKVWWVTVIGQAGGRQTN